MMKTDALIASGHGRGGLTCSTCEMDPERSGIDIDVATRAPARVGMTAYEIMLSESRSGCSWSSNGAASARFETIFEKWICMRHTSVRSLMMCLMRCARTGTFVAEIPTGRSRLCTV